MSVLINAAMQSLLKIIFYKKRGLTIANSRAFCLIIYSKRDVFAILTAYLGDNGIGNIGYV